MILCSNCGSQVPEVLASCQFCGTPVPRVNNTSNRSGANGFAPGQPELPAWLETLRSSERPPAPASNDPLYALPGSIDENALPSWMRSDKMDNSAKMPALRPASRPAPNTEGSAINTVNAANLMGMSASSLIDEQSLPSWMQDLQTSAQRGQENISAASLVQQDALPQWMRAASSQSPQEQPTTPPIPQQVTPAYTSPSAPPQRVSANELIDSQSLPSWMSAQTPGTLTTGNAPGNLNGSSLIDPNSLPPWLREGVQQEQRGSMPSRMAGAVVPQPVSPVQPAQAIQHVQPVQAMPPTQATGANNNISASSFIDMEALPAWLRSAEEQRGVAGFNGVRNGSEQNRPGVAGPPARVENMRVPSRPRAEMPSLEESAVAANVFASMLGVASTNVPGQLRNGYMPPSAPAAQSSPGAGSISGSNWSGFPEGNASAQLPPLVPPQGYNISASPNGLAGSPAQGSAMQSMPDMSPQPIQLPGSYSANQAQQWNQGMSYPGTGNNVQNRPSSAGQQRQNGKKRGFLETILNWFPFSR